MKFINSCKEREHELDIPVIVCNVSNKMNVAFLLKDLKMCFSEMEYNIYTAGLEPENVLYELEYIPEQSLKRASKVKDFIYWQTFYSQSDGILFSVTEEKHNLIEQLFNVVDVTIKIKKINNEYFAEIYSEGITVSKVRNYEMDKKFVRNIVNQLIRILTEEENG